MPELTHPHFLVTMKNFYIISLLFLLSGIPALGADETEAPAENRYHISFWNYQPVGLIDEVKAVKDWKDCGINLPMTFEFDPARHDKARMIKLLDECQKEGMKAIVCDARTTYRRLMEVGEKEFCKGVREAVEDFGGHPAVFGFHVGDEPDAKAWESAIKAFRIVQDAAPGLTAFLNMFPYWEEPSFAEVLGCDGTMNGYAEKLIDFVRRSGAKIISFDSYGQCAYFQREYYQDVHMKGLNIFSRVAKETGAELYVSLLSVGHWGYRVPDRDDFRWQLYSAVAHGATGIHWFQFYESPWPAGSYRECPVNRYGERSSTYMDLSSENRYFMDIFSEKLSRCRFDSVSHYGRPFGNFPLFDGSQELTRIVPVVNTDISLAVTRWIDQDGDPCFTVTSLERELPTKIKVFFEAEGPLKGKYFEGWLAPGQMLYIDKNGLWNA